MRGPAFAVQQEFLEALLDLAEAERKPVVFHCVRAAEELMAAMKRHPGIRGLYHGFRGKPELLEKLRHAGFYLSLGPAFLNNAALCDYLKTAGLERIGFETDDSPEPLGLLLGRAAARLGMSPEALEEQTDRTFDAFLG
ncbi:hypothetical protein SDC9_162372 [bioreactor metagenome]|uniref:Metal-dependent hydrolase YcfH n=1 Tax=bioreactor metagenome TaxID=1076179 RepID=A0A645FSI5_9ZZZZ